MRLWTYACIVGFSLAAWTAITIGIMAVLQKW
jgi:hypothetical protein